MRHPVGRFTPPGREPVDLEIGKRFQSFEFGTRDLAHEAMLVVAALIAGGDLEGISINAWAHTLEGHGFVTVLTEEHDELAAAFETACERVETSGGARCETPEDLLEAQVNKRVRNLREGGAMDIDPAGPMARSLYRDGSLG